MGLKRLLRPAVDQLARFSGRLRHHEHAMTKGVTILMYHRVLEDEAALNYPLASLAMPQNAFAEQMRWVSKHTEVMTLSQALASEGQRQDESGKPMVCITFDDGFRDNAEIAAPILARLDLKATFFLTAGLVGTDQQFWFDVAARVYERLGEEGIRQAKGRLFENRSDWMTHLKLISNEERVSLLDELGSEDDSGEATLMTWDQAKDLCEQGHEIGSHTMSHPLLPQLDDDALRGELSNSKQLLEEKLGQAIPGFCYPNGDHNKRVIAAVKTAGYEWACTTQSGRVVAGGDPFRLARLDITPQRVLHNSGEHNELGFRSEISLLRDHFRLREYDASPPDPT